ncbi:hypothetical protein NE237_012501 [Protea cynaroides]|uniref:Uncharacterized protein n=1 Tax=Protea cynaroides TaxID=273540 RepID=A0A9Q0GZX1_9MAGN|nr:hypothetical protein NE237_012501 [Protea cynaroides]
MAKIYPQLLSSSSSSSSSSASSSSYASSRRETFTIWMKSLVLHGNGCTVYNSSGEIVYRVDNYHDKCRNEVDLMDLQGNLLFTIHRKKLSLFGCWEGYRYNGSKSNKGKPWFQVKRILKGKSSYKVTVESDQPQPNCYTIERLITGKSDGYRILLNDSGDLVAEVKQKQLPSGVSLGSDVLNLVVEPHVDHSLIMGIVTVYGLISHKL